MVNIGIDIGSTTAKVVAVGEDGSVLFSRYERHNANAREVVARVLGELQAALGDMDVCARLTGSVGMGFSEKYGYPFVQEVVAATKAVQKSYPETSSMIDIGGEDAKVVFFRDGRAADLRMNGNCAGGTGAFIDQMAVLLGVSVGELDGLAARAVQVYPIASRSARPTYKTSWPRMPTRPTLRRQYCTPWPCRRSLRWPTAAKSRRPCWCAAGR